MCGIGKRRCQYIPLVDLWITNRREQTKDGALYMKANPLIEKRRGEIDQVRAPIILSLLKQNLPDLCATKQVLFIRQQKIDESHAAGPEASSKGVVKKTFMEERENIIVQTQDMFGDHRPSISRIRIQHLRRR